MGRTATDAETQFREHARGFGIELPAKLEPGGKICRFDPKTGRKGGNGWYAFHTDGIPAGAFGDWSADVNETWSASLGRTLTEAERKAEAARVKALQRARDLETARRQREIAKEAADIWSAAGEAPEDYPYLRDKRIKPHGIRVHESRLIVPLSDADNALHSWQAISANGKDKRFAPGGRVEGCFYLIGGPLADGAEILIGEGFATVASCHEATGRPAVVALNTGNLLKVATALRAKYPALRFIFCADHDAWTKGNPGENKAIAAAQAVGGKVAVPAFSGIRTHGETDFNDLATAEGLDAVRQCIEAALEPESAAPVPAPETGAPDGEERRSQSQKILELAHDIELFHCPDRRAYAQATLGEHHIVAPIESREFRLLLLGRYWEAYAGAPGDEPLRIATTTLAAKALFGGEQHEVHLRTARHNGTLYLNLARGDGAVVEIAADGWRIVRDSPVKFWRAPGMMALPVPKRGGSIAALARLLNLATKQDFILAVAWLMGALNSGPYPIAALAGEQGTAKSTATRFLRRLIDPNKALLRSLPREERDLAITAQNSHVLTFDNLSGLPAWTSDALCKLATGGGFACRELYSNDGEYIFATRRPIIMNGIEDFATRSDLADRCIFLRLRPIPEDSRKTEAELDAIFEREAPRLIGALLDAAVYALAHPRTLPSRPRMADFAEWAATCEGYFAGTVLPFDDAPIWGAGDFIAAYTSNRADATETVLDADPIGVALRSFMEGRERWTGTTTGLLDELRQLVKEETRRDREFPANARALSARLRRLAPALRRTGLEIEYKRAGGPARTRLIELSQVPLDTEVGKFTSSSSLRPQSERNANYTNGLDADANEDAEFGAASAEDEFASSNTDRRTQNGSSRTQGISRPSSHNTLKTNGFLRKDAKDAKFSILHTDVVEVAL